MHSSRAQVKQDPGARQKDSGYGKFTNAQGSALRRLGRCGDTRGKDLYVCSTDTTYRNYRVKGCQEDFVFGMRQSPNADVPVTNLGRFFEKREIGADSGGESNAKAKDRAQAAQSARPMRSTGRALVKVVVPLPVRWTGTRTGCRQEWHGDAFLHVH